MPRKPIPVAPKRRPTKYSGIKIPSAMHRATKAAGTWTPRNTGYAKGKVKRQPCRYSDALIEAALKKNKGLVTYAARAIKMDYSTMSSRIKNNPRLEAVRTAAKEAMKDSAESVLTFHLKKNSLDAAKHITKYLCRDRGYIERQEQLEIAPTVDLDGMTDDQITGLIEAISKRLGTKGDLI